MYEHVRPGSWRSLLFYDHSIHFRIPRASYHVVGNKFPLRGGGEEGGEKRCGGLSAKSQENGNTRARVFDERAAVREKIRVRERRYKYEQFLFDPAVFTALHRSS